MLSLWLASCCIVDVVNGGAGFEKTRSFHVVYVIVALSHKVGNRIRFVRARWLNFLAVLVVERGNEKICFCLFAPSFKSIAFIVQYSSGVKSRISFSLSTIILSAADCTRPAERLGLSFLERMGEIL